MTSTDDVGQSARERLLTGIPVSDQTERFHTVVIGAGQAGLATGYHLAQNGVDDFALLEANQRLGDSWRNRWDSLRLFTPASWSDLPGMPFPSPAKPHFPARKRRRTTSSGTRPSSGYRFGSGSA